MGEKAEKGKGDGEGRKRELKKIFQKTDKRVTRLWLTRSRLGVVTSQTSVSKVTAYGMVELTARRVGHEMINAAYLRRQPGNIQSYTAAEQGCGKGIGLGPCS